MSDSNSCFLVCTQISQEAGKVSVIPISLRIFHSLLYSSQSKALVLSLKQKKIFVLEFSCFFNDPADVGNLISGSSALSKSSLNFCK